MGTKPWKSAAGPRSRRIIVVPWIKPRMRGLGDFLSSIMDVLMDSNGVTANTDSITPAPRPASTVRGPDIRPVCGSERTLLRESKVRKRIPALMELPTMSVVHPAYHSRPNLGLEGDGTEEGSGSVVIL